MLYEVITVIHEERPDNIAMAQFFDHGDIEAGKAESDFVVEGEYNVHYVTHCNMRNNFV